MYVDGQPIVKFPGVPQEPVDLRIPGVVDLLLVVLSVAIKVAGEGIRKGIAGIDRVTEVGAEVVGAGGVVDRVHADVAGLLFDVDASFDCVRTLDPGHGVGQVLTFIGPVKRPPAVETEGRKCRDASGR